ncbi:MAG: hypothetical protein ACRCTY_08190 [Candidatus Adiutrix sp.]
MYNRLTQKALLKLAFVAFLASKIVFAGSAFQSNQATDETSEPVSHAVALASCPLR